MRSSEKISADKLIQQTYVVIHTEITKFNTTKCKGIFPYQQSFQSCRRALTEKQFPITKHHERHSEGAIIHTQKISTKDSLFS